MAQLVFKKTVRPELSQMFLLSWYHPSYHNNWHLVIMYNKGQYQHFIFNLYCGQKNKTNQAHNYVGKSQGVHCASIQHVESVLHAHATSLQYTGPFSTHPPTT